MRLFAKDIDYSILDGPLMASHFQAKANLITNGSF